MTTAWNPTRDEIEAMIAKAEQTNGRYRERTATFPADLADRIEAEPDGLIQVDGGGVANKYGYSTRSTVLGAAWGIWPDGTKVVRIEGAQYRCCGRHVTPIWTARANLRDLLPAPIPIGRSA
jgi:hypothetical protein